MSFLTTALRGPSLSTSAFHKGYILSPTLFLVHMYDMLPLTNIPRYADDSTVHGRYFGATELRVLASEVTVLQLIVFHRFVNGFMTFLYSTVDKFKSLPVHVFPSFYDIRPFKLGGKRQFVGRQSGGG